MEHKQTVTEVKESRLSVKQKVLFGMGDYLNTITYGMISAFLGYVFSDVMNVTHGDFSGLIPVLVMLTSAVVMVICGVAAMRTKKRWIQDYALPISMLCGMAVSIPLTNWLS